MNTSLMTPYDLWVNALKELREKTINVMKSKIFVSSDIYYINGDDEGMGIVNGFFNSSTLCIASLDDSGEIHRVAHIEIDPIPFKENICFSFIIYADPNDNGVPVYSQIEELEMPYSVLSNELIYNEIAEWINGNDLNVQIFFEIAEQEKQKIIS